MPQSSRMISTLRACRSHCPGVACAVDGSAAATRRMRKMFFTAGDSVTDKLRQECAVDTRIYFLYGRAREDLHVRREPGGTASEDSPVSRDAARRRRLARREACHPRTSRRVDKRFHGGARLLE